MKQSKIVMVVLCFSMNAHACFLRKIVNNSPTTNILVRRKIIPGLRKGEHGTVIRRRPLNADKPRVVVANVGIGEHLDFAVNEKTSYGQTCKDYRIVCDEKNETLMLQKKDGCSVDRLTYDTIYETSIDPENCYVDVHVQSDANSLTIEVSNEKDESAAMPADKKARTL